MDITKTQQGVPCVTLNGRLFEISRWGAEEQTDTLFELIGILGDAAGGLADIYKRNHDPDAEIAQDVMSSLIGKLTSGVTRDRAASKRLMLKLASGERVVCDGAPVRNYSTFYEENLFLAFQVAAANLKVQYGNFFSAAGSYLMPAKAAQMAQPAA